ncbi:MAG TPA: putative Ig domain-containing protein, partial [Planctomycetota bacterium]|nr:putative Ig domain-containing protein [Planctomycetota bacterium]
TMTLAGVYSGTPTATGTYTFNVTATNTAGSTTVPYTQTINVLSPTITAPLSLDDGFAGVATSTTFQATGSPPITWSISAGTLPPGIGLTPGGVYSGTPTVAGVYTFSITAANTGGSNTLAYVQQIGPLPPTIISPLTLQGDVQGVTTSTQFQAYGTKPLVWSVSSGSLPPGIAFTASGLYSGTPTATGSYTFRISATNIYGVDSITYTQMILPPTPPTITGPPSPITTATVGVPFSVSFTASGDPPPTWSVQAGAVPSGLVLGTDGVLSGTPTVAGVFTFTVAAANIAATATAAYAQGVVAPPPPPPEANTLQVTTLGAGAAAPPGTAGVLALALLLAAGPSEDVQVSAIDLSTIGLTAQSEVASVHLVLDANGDRTLDSADTTIATTSFDGFGAATLAFSLTVKAGTQVAVFVTYDLAASAPPGTLGTTIPSGGVTATGLTTGLPANVTSLPVSGSVLIEAPPPPPPPPPTFSGGGGGGGGGGCAIEPRSGSPSALVAWVLVALLVLRRRQG